MVFQNPKLRLLHKAVAFAFFLWVLRSGDFSFWSVSIFFVATIFLYATPLFRAIEIAPFFSVFLFVAFLTLRAISHPYYFFLAAIYFTGIFYLIIGMKELTFVDREDWQRVLALAIAYPAYLLFFYYYDSGLMIKFFSLFLGLFTLSKAVLRQSLPSWLVSFLALEITWATLFLPIGFLSQAGVVAISYFSLLDTTYHFLEGRLTKKIIMIHVTLLSVLTLLVAAFSSWGVS